MQPYGNTDCHRKWRSTELSTTNFGTITPSSKLNMNTQKLNIREKWKKGKERAANKKLKMQQP